MPSYIYEEGLDQPAKHAALVTPSDSTDLTVTARALLVGTSGDIKVTTAGGDTLVIPSVPAGVLPLRVSRVWSTSTTASNITALY